MKKFLLVNFTLFCLFAASVAIAQSEVKWTVAENNVNMGSFSVAEIHDKVKSGAITDKALVWKPGMSKWVPIKSIPELTPPAPKPVAPTPASSPGDVKWTVAENNVNLGSFSVSQVHAKRKSGEITDQALVWKPGMTGWVSIKTVAELEPPKPVQPPVAATPPLMEKPPGAVTPPAPQVKEWSIAQNGNTTGPFTKDEVQQKIDNNEITDRVHVWKKGMSGWVVITTVDDFKFPTPTAAAVPAQAATQETAATGPEQGSQTVQLDPANQGGADVMDRPCSKNVFECKSSAVANGAPARVGTGAVGTGFGFFVLGYGLFVGGGLSVSEAPGLAIAFMGIGGISAAIGGVIGTAGLTARYNAFVEAGYAVPNKKAVTWTLSLLNVGLTTGGLFVPNIIAGISMLGVGMILETINTLSVKKKWNLAILKAGASGQRSVVKSVTFFPVAYASTDTMHRTNGGVFGLGGTF